MSETGSNSDDKKTKVRRQPKPESVLTPTFAAVRQSTSGSLWDRNQLVGGLLQRQCACGMHTIGGGECDGCRQDRTTAGSIPANTTPLAPAEIQAFPISDFGQDFSPIPIHTIEPTLQRQEQPNGGTKQAGGAGSTSAPPTANRNP